MFQVSPAPAPLFGANHPEMRASAQRAPARSQGGRLIGSLFQAGSGWGFATLVRNRCQDGTAPDSTMNT